ASLVLYEGLRLGGSGPARLSLAVALTSELVVALLTIFIADLMEREWAVARRNEYQLFRIKAVHGFGQKAREYLQLSQLAEALWYLVPEVLPADAGILLVRSSERSEFHVESSWGLSDEALSRLRPILAGGSSGWMAGLKKALLLGELNPDWQQSDPRKLPARSAAVAPLIFQGKTLGALLLFNTRSNEAFSAETVGLMDELAREVAAPLANSLDRARIENEAKRLSGELETVYRSSLPLPTDAELAQQLRHIVEVACQALGSKAGLVASVEEKDGRMSVEASVGIPADHLRILRLRVGLGDVGSAVSRRQAVSYADVFKEPDYAPLLTLARELGYRSTISAPILTAEAVYGALTVMKGETHEFSLDETWALSILAQRAAAVIEDARLRQRLRHESAELQAALQRIGVALGAGWEKEKVWHTIVDLAASILHAEACTLQLLDEHTQELRYQAARGIPMEQVAQLRVKAGQGMWGRIIVDGSTLHFPDMQADPRGPELPLGRDAKLRACLAVPVRAESKFLGVLAVYMRMPYRFSPPEIELLTSFASQAAIAVERVQMLEKNTIDAANYERLHEVSKTVASSLELKQALDNITTAALEISGGDVASIMLLDAESQELTIAAAQGLADEVVRSTRVKVGEGVAGWVVEHGQSLLFQDGIVDRRLQESPYRKGHFTDYLRTFLASDEKHFTAGVTGGQSPIWAVSAPLAVKGKTFGVLNVHAVGPRRRFGEGDLRLVEGLASQAAIALENSRLYERVQSLFVETLAALASTLETKDPYTKGHSERVRDLSVGIARHMALPDDQVNVLRSAALLHDLGKIGVDDAVLHKNGILTHEEKAQMQLHPAASGKILEYVDFLRDAARLAGAHHEWYDGSGYPNGLAGESIPLGARILMVADAYEAMTSDRPYRAKMEPQEAIAEIKRYAGTQFDPKVVEALISFLSGSGPPEEHPAGAASKFVGTPPRIS
ncbi:MAG: GAF domain-containing protein, partial [Chloroflexi bacterium]|nr:GAF domain-containing protein [Chloroflexota bacterium]